MNAASDELKEKVDVPPVVDPAPKTVGGDAKLLNPVAPLLLDEPNAPKIAVVGATPVEREEDVDALVAAFVLSAAVPVDAAVPVGAAAGVDVVVESEFFGEKIVAAAVVASGFVAGFASSHTWHCVADASLLVSQSSHFHPAAASAVELAGAEAVDAAGAAEVVAAEVDELDEAAVAVEAAGVDAAAAAAANAGIVAPKLNAGMLTPVGALIALRLALTITRPCMVSLLAGCQVPPCSSMLSAPSRS